MTTSRSASAAADSDRCTFLGGRLADPLGEPVHVLDLRRVGAQGVDPAIERGRRRRPRCSARSDQNR